MGSAARHSCDPGRAGPPGRPPLPERHRVCVEPEDGPWPQTTFSGVTPERLEAAWRDHPMQRMFYGDEPAMRDKPDNVRRLVVSQMVKDSLEALTLARYTT